MNLETFFEKFELFADAPDAVAKMRELVLELAVRGKLVEQKPEEHSAIECIRRANKPLVAVASDDLVEIPVGWVALPLGCLIASNTGGGTPSKQYPSYWNGRIPWASVKDVQSEKYLISTIDSITEEGLRDSSSNLIPPNRLIVVTRMGLGKLAINTIPIAINQDLRAIEPTTALDLDFAYLLFKSLKLVGSGVTVKGITVDKLHSMPVWMPPLAEQKRIVAKVDELMALCDRLEAQQQERETRHAALARASLARFAEAPTPANLPFLFHSSFSIPPSDLRKSILTLAVQGKLVPQDPNDEPAEVLIERIAAMRRVNKGKQYEPVLSDEVPYEVPFSWSWVRLGNISMTSDSGWSPQCLPEARSGSDWGVLKVSAVSWGIFKPEENKALPQGMTSRPDCEVKAGDFLLSRANTEELVARSVVVDQTPPRLMMSDKIVRFTFPAEIERAFINLANMSDPSRAYYVRNASGTSSSMKNIGREVMCNLPIPLPPLAEQRRIVAKVEQMMALVDVLERQLASSRATAANLLAAIVAELTGTPHNGKVSLPATSRGRGRPPQS